MPPCSCAAIHRPLRASSIPLAIIHPSHWWHASAWRLLHVEVRVWGHVVQPLRRTTLPWPDCQSRRWQAFRVLVARGLVCAAAREL